MKKIILLNIVLFSLLAFGQNEKQKNKTQFQTSGIRQKSNNKLVNFITRNGDQLKDGEKVFRFIGVNAPNINGQYDGYKNANPESGYLYDPIELSFEMENYFKDMDQMGVTVFRNLGILVADGTLEYEALVDVAYKYNETAFRKNR
ncbi:MAG: hypothetical protein WCP85_29935 [Mariniphaga sp.]